MPRVFVTGDKHGNFNFLKTWCDKVGTTKDDYLIVLGDCGINYYLNKTDKHLKYRISQCPITLICVHGNHEARPATIKSYVKEFNYDIQCGVWYEKEFPNILFPDDGEMIINNKTFLILGGAYSVDKQFRLERGGQWFSDEQMSDITKNRILRFIQTENSFDYILSHCAPLKNEPIHLFLSFIKQQEVDKSMEKFLDIVSEQVEFDYWFLGHYHSDEWLTPKMRLFYNDIIELNFNEDNYAVAAK